MMQRWLSLWNWEIFQTIRLTHRSPAKKKRRAALSYQAAGEAKLALFQGPRYHVFGNHDTDQASKAEVQVSLINTGIPADQTYYSFDAGSVQCEDCSRRA